MAQQIQTTTCPLCQPSLPGELIRHPSWVIIDAADPWFPGFTRVIWTDHTREMTDLPKEQQRLIMDVVFAVEEVMRASLSPDKVNLASLGNQAPHLHWHVIPRWVDDVAYPDAVWTRALGNDTTAAQRRRAQTQSALADYHGNLLRHFCAKPS